MALSLSPMTELDAVNLMLVNIGEQPVNALEIGGVSEVSIARFILHNTSRAVQTDGLRCNTEYNYKLIPDENGFLSLPMNALKVDASDPTVNVVVRGKRLYDVDNHTYIFKEPLLVDIVFFLPYEELPQAVRTYICIRAAREFGTKILGSETLNQFSLQDEQTALLTMVRQEIDIGDFTLLDNPNILYGLKRRF